MEKAAFTSLCWVPRGKSRVRTEPQEAAAGDVESPSGAGAAPAARGPDELEERFQMDQYDDEADEDGLQFFSVLNSDGMLAGTRDPYVTGQDSDSESDGEQIGAEDKVFAAVSCEEDSCSLELYIFDEEQATMYVHHDAILSAYPLCMDWLSISPTVGEGSFAAIGLIDYSIQIWDLDELEALEPCFMLGPTKKAKPKRRVPMAGAGGPKAHDGPVLAVHSSPFNHSVLASGAADQTVKVWDVSENSCVHSYSHHVNKVQCARWHPTEQAVLLSAAFDRSLALLDVRQPGKVATAPLPAEAESAIWRRHQPFECLASVDNGCVACYDVRKVAAKSSESAMIIWTLQAYDVACTSVQDMPTPDCLVTCGLDGIAKVWNCSDAAPKLVMDKNLQAGPLFACQSSSEEPALVCFGGSIPCMWDLTSERLLREVFKLEGQEEAAA